MVQRACECWVPLSNERRTVLILAPVLHHVHRVDLLTEFAESPAETELRQRREHDGHGLSQTSRCLVKDVVLDM